MSQRFSGASSKRMRWSSSQNSGRALGRGPLKALKASDVQKEAENARKRQRDQKVNHERSAGGDLADYPGLTSDDGHDFNAQDSEARTTLRDVLEGRLALDISNAGGEFSDVINASTGVKSKKKKKQTYDGRTRRDRLERRNQGFEVQISMLTDAFMLWKATVGKDGFEGTCPNVLDAKPGLRVLKIDVVDVFSSFKYLAEILPEDTTVATCIVRHGIIPNSPFKPSYGISIRTLEAYRSVHLRCPHLALEPYIRGLFDLHGRVYKPSFQRHFSDCYDLYIRLKDEVQKRVDGALKRDKENWRRRNACPACTYRLEDEPKLAFDILVTMDGNDSLKRVLKRGDDMVEVEGQQGTSAVYQSNERPDSRDVEGDYYLGRDDVNKWARGVIHGALAEGEKAVGVGEGDEEATPCEGRWKNMDTDATARMWGVFDETGIFLCLCRHGFVLVLLDMVQSGELTKYPLAVVNALLDAFGADIGGSYDIGCQFKGRLRSSPLGERAEGLNFRPLVGSFHGHAHNRLCQLSNLATYVEGLGLEDLEGCERFFSKSNVLAAALRYASVFHRKQKIQEYVKHCDSLDTSQNLSKFLVDNYNQALEIIATEKIVLQKMKDHGINDPKVFVEWRKEEHEYLLSLANEPVHETLQMDYYQKLVNLYDSEYDSQTHLLALADLFNRTKYKELQQAFKMTWVAYDPSAAVEDPQSSSGH